MHISVNDIYIYIYATRQTPPMSTDISFPYVYANVLIRSAALYRRASCTNLPYVYALAISLALMCTVRYPLTSVQKVALDFC